MHIHLHINPIKIKTFIKNYMFKRIKNRVYLKIFKIKVSSMDLITMHLVYWINKNPMQEISGVDFLIMRILPHKKQNNKSKCHIVNNYKGKWNKQKEESSKKNKKFKKSRWRGRGSFMNNFKSKLKWKTIKIRLIIKMGILWLELFINSKKIRVRTHLKNSPT